MLQALIKILLGVAQEAASHRAVVAIISLHRVVTEISSTDQLLDGS